MNALVEIPKWVEKKLEDLEARLRLVERLLWIVFGIGSGVGAVATLIGSGTLKALLKALS